MPPKQRQVRIEGAPRGAQQAIAALELRSDEELEAETTYKAAALAILGARAAERFDNVKARAYFQRAIAAARPQERMQIRRMADVSLAMAERRPDDLKEAVARLGQTAPTGRQLLALRAMGLFVPASGAGLWRRTRGILLIILLIVLLLGAGTGVVKAIAIPAGGLGWPASVLLGIFVVAAVIAVLAVVNRKRRAKALAERDAAAAERAAG
ncbi:MAG TPA: hypothetical protein VHX88_06620 [Solirubrobacteraceae bacterium]|nr:hypothetical protein [Solirubrobacteraceae bacterium]